MDRGRDSRLTSVLSRCSEEAQASILFPSQGPSLLQWPWFFFTLIYRDVSFLTLGLHSSELLKSPRICNAEAGIFNQGCFCSPGDIWHLTRDTAVATSIMGVITGVSWVEARIARKPPTGRGGDSPAQQSIIWSRASWQEDWGTGLEEPAVPATRGQAARLKVLCWDTQHH